jgi:hypothetical protein
MSGLLAGNGKSAPFLVHRARNTAPPYTQEEVVFENGGITLPDKRSDIRDSWEGQMGFEYGPVLAHLTKPLLALFRTGYIDTDGRDGRGASRRAA